MRDRHGEGGGRCVTTTTTTTIDMQTRRGGGCREGRCATAMQRTSETMTCTCSSGPPILSRSGIAEACASFSPLSDQARTPAGSGIYLVSSITNKCTRFTLTTFSYASFVSLLKYTSLALVASCHVVHVAGQHGRPHRLTIILTMQSVNSSDQS